MNHNNYRNPVSWVPSVYFAMGLPFIAVNLVSTFMFKDLGISDTQIAFWTSIIMMPWTLKFLWSPFLEMYRTKKFFVVITQLLSGLLFGLVAFSLKFDYFFAISISTMAVIAFSGATHDIACDGVYMAELHRCAGGFLQHRQIGGERRTGGDGGYAGPEFRGDGRPFYAGEHVCL